MLAFEQREKQPHTRGSRSGLGRQDILVGGAGLVRPPQGEQRVSFSLADVHQDRPSFVPQRGHLADDIEPPLAIAQRHDPVASQPDDEALVHRRSCPGLDEQRLEN